MKHFELIGHDCPYGCYPAPVIPIGELDGELVAVCPGGKLGPTPEPVGGGRYVEHSPALNRLLSPFDMQRQRLFAYSEQEVDSYDVEQEGQFLQDFLSRQEFRNMDPGIRQMLASHVQSRVAATGLLQTTR